MAFLDDPLPFFLALPAVAVPAFVFAAAFFEYVTPPVPGDSCLLVGFFLAGQGVASPWEVFVAAVLGSVLGGWAAYRLGGRYGDAVLRRVRIRSSGRAEARFRQMVANRGERVLAINRFLPVVRGVMLYGAGALGLRFRRVMAYNAASATAFVALLCGVGLVTAGSWAEIQAVFGDLRRAAGAAAFLAVVGWLGWSFRRSVLGPEKLPAAD